MGTVPNTDLEKYAEDPGKKEQPDVPQKVLDRESWNEESRPEPSNPQPPPEKKEE